MKTNKKRELKQSFVIEIKGLYTHRHKNTPTAKVKPERKKNIVEKRKKKKKVQTSFRRQK